MEKKKSTINIRLDKKLKDEYLKYCFDNGYSLSKRIRKLLENDIKNG